MESLRQLRHVIALADHGHFGRAAAVVGITQAALTLSIQKLEESYGVPLFERRKGEVVVTQYGEIVLEAARATVSRVTHMRRKLTLTRQLSAGRLIVGCDAHFADALAAPALARVMKEYPRLEFTLESGRWSRMKKRLLDKEIDVYLGFELDGPDPEFSIETHSIPPFVAFCRDGHKILEVADPGLLDCFEYPVVIPPTTRWIQNRVRPHMARAGLVRAPTYLYTSDYAIIRRFVRGSDALGFGQLRDIEDEVRSGLFRYFTVKEVSTEVGVSIISVERRSPPVATQVLLGAVREEIAEMNREWAMRGNTARANNSPKGWECDKVH